MIATIAALCDRRLLPLGALGLLGCNTVASSTCGDGVLDEGEACLVPHGAVLQEFVTAGDIDGDGLTDLVVVADRDVARVAVRRGRSDGSFGPAGLGRIGPTLPSIAAVGDADGDGTPDLLLWRAGATEAEICAFTLDPQGTFTATWCRPAPSLPGSLPSEAQLHIGALGPAGEAGFAAWSVGQTSIVVDPAGAATTTVLDMPITSNGTVPLMIADLDGDGRDALLWIADDMLEQHTPPWTTPMRSGVPRGYAAGVIADFDGDGVDDIALSNVACHDGPTVQLRRSTGGEVSATFGPRKLCLPPIAADLDGDGRSELVVVDDGRLRVLWGDALAHDDAVEAEEIDTPPRSSQPFGLIPGDINGDGIDDLLLTVATDGPAEGGYWPRWIDQTWLGDP